MDKQRSRNSKYVIVDDSTLTWRKVNLSNSTDLDHPRKSMDGSKRVLEFLSDVPDEFLDQKIYNHSEILSIMENDSEWKDPDANPDIVKDAEADPTEITVK